MLICLIKEVPQGVKFQNKLPAKVHTSRPVITFNNLVIIKSVTPKSSIKSYPTTTEKNVFSFSKNEFQVTENAHHSNPTLVQKETINNNKGRKEVLHPLTIIKPNDQLISTSFVTPQISYSPSHENGVSGPNPGEFPIISLIDEPAVNYYEQILETIGTTKDGSNPYYSQEEFTYNQDPIHIDHNDQHEKDIEEITQSVFDEVEIVDDASHFKVINDQLSYQNESKKKDSNKIKTTSTTQKTLTILSNNFLESNNSEQYREKSPIGLKLKSRTSRQHLFKTSVKSKESTNLVNTIEYKPADIKQRNKHKHIRKVIDNLGSLVDCGSDSEIRFCSMGSSYPKARIEAVVENCSDIIEAFKAIVTEDFDALGDNSINVISSEKDLTRPWSWNVYAYKKRQTCDSELSFTRPSYALDTEGKR